MYVCIVYTVHGRVFSHFMVKYYMSVTHAAVHHCCICDPSDVLRALRPLPLYRKFSAVGLHVELVLCFPYVTGSICFCFFLFLFFKMYVHHYLRAMEIFKTIYTIGFGQQNRKTLTRLIKLRFLE